MKTLKNISPGESGVVRFVEAAGNMKIRLIDLGFLPGEEVKCLRVSPLGDPKAYLVRGAVYAVRGEDAEQIKMQ